MSYRVEEFYDGKWKPVDIAMSFAGAADTLWNRDASLPPFPRRIIDETGTPILYGRHPMPVTAPAPEPDIKPWWGVYRSDTPQIMGQYPDERSAVEPARSLVRGGTQYVVAKVTPVLVVGFVERRVGGEARGE